MIAREQNIHNMAQHLDLLKDELHLSTDLYDTNGEYIGCNFVIDVDCKGNLRRALDDTRIVSTKLNSLGIKHVVYHSGNKGFHIDTGTIILGDLAQRTCSAIVAKHFDLPTVDRQIYRRNGTIRAEGSINLSTGRRKIAVDVNESLDQMVDRSREFHSIQVNQRIYNFDSSPLLDGIELPIARQYDSNSPNEFFSVVKPCVKSIINSEIYEGNRNTAVYVIVHSLLSSGQSAQQVADYFNNSEFWQDQGTSWKATLSTAIRNGVKGVSCKHGFTSQLMQEHCQEYCWIKECDLSTIFKSWRNNGKSNECF